MNKNLILKTKSVQNKKSKSDGIRICVMRRIQSEFEFDIWMPSLAPSTKLLKDYHDGKVNWETFEKKIKKESLNEKNEYVQILNEIINKHNVTILCVEKKGENCHRLIIAKLMREINPKLKIKHV